MNEETCIPGVLTQRKAQLHKSLYLEEIIRPGTRITRIKRIYTDYQIYAHPNKETCIPGVLTLRDNTGRPVEAGSNVPAGTEAMIRCARGMLARGNRWKNPLGDGRAAEKIYRVVKMMKKR